jgi:hypothetical protein
MAGIDADQPVGVSEDRGSGDEIDAMFRDIAVGPVGVPFKIHTTFIYG